MFLASGFSITGNHPLIWAVILLCMEAFARVATSRPRIRPFGISIRAFAQISVISIAAMMLTYAAAATTAPLADPYLLSFDEWIGYDWRRYAALFASSPLLARLVLPNYWWIFLQPIIAIGALTAGRRVQRLETYVLAMLVSLVITIGLFAMFPATTAWTYRGIDDSRIVDLGLPTAGEGWVHTLFIIRSGGGRVLDGVQGCGIIAFPSFHCISALLFIWAMWPVRTTRPAVALSSGLMIAATPILGGHYLADLIGGAGVALLSVFAAKLCHSRLISLKSRFIPHKEGAGKEPILGLS